MTSAADYAGHNEEVRRVWDAYWRGAPIRVPVGNFTIGPRIWVLDPRLNTHICGNVQRHFPTLIRELNVGSFDTGFPIRFETLRDEIGEAVHVSGGVPVDILLRGTPAEVARETRRILASGVTRGGRFIMKEANNMPPRTPLENIRAMYETVRQSGER